jgi:hypothetical protein
LSFELRFIFRGKDATLQEANRVVKNGLYRHFSISILDMHLGAYRMNYSTFLQASPRLQPVAVASNHMDARENGLLKTNSDGF